MGRLIDADAFAEKIKEISIRQGYYDFYPKSMSVGEILDSVIADLKGEGVCGFENAPTVDAVPWEFLERYAEWFCATVSFPGFIREAKQFYLDAERYERIMLSRCFQPNEPFDDDEEEEEDEQN